jgi:cytochrome c oxidase subunit 1
MPLHLVGILGQPRRYYTYPAGIGWEAPNLISTLGVTFIILSVLVFLYNALVSWRRGEVAGDDPWDAWTLEWTTSSPPPVYNFAETPTVRGRRPLYDLKHPDNPDPSDE